MTATTGTKRLTVEEAREIQDQYNLDVRRGSWVNPAFDWDVYEEWDAREVDPTEPCYTCAVGLCLVNAMGDILEAHDLMDRSTWSDIPTSPFALPARNWSEQTGYSYAYMSGLTVGFEGNEYNIVVTLDYDDQGKPVTAPFTENAFPTEEERTEFLLGVEDGTAIYEALVTGE